MPSYADGETRAAGEEQTLRRKRAEGDPPEEPGGLGASPGAARIAQLQAIIDRSPRVQDQASLAAVLNRRTPEPQAVVQRYEGDSLTTLRDFLRDLLQSGRLAPPMDVQQVYGVVYDVYNRGPGPARDDHIPVNDDPVGVLRGENFGIPLGLITQANGFVKIDNPEYQPAMEGLTPQRLSVHVNPTRILEAMRGIYDVSTHRPQVASFKMPSGQDAIRNRMDNLVIYFLDDAEGSTRADLVSVLDLFAGEGYLMPEHPPMLAPTGIPGVGSAEGWYSFGDQRSRAIAEAYVGWNKQGGLDALLTRSLKVLEDKGYDTGDLSKQADEKRKCYISTACSHALGLPDDCLELQALRWLRDAHVRRLPAGRQELEAYYDLAPSVVRAVAVRPDRDEVYARIYRRLVAPVVTRVLAGDLAGGFRLYKRRVLGLAESPSTW